MSSRLQLLLAHADDHQPTLKAGLSPEAATRAPRPEERGPQPDTLWHQGGELHSLPLQRWGIVAPEGPEGERLVALLEPLKKLREEEQGADAPVFFVGPGMDAARAMDWRRRVLMARPVAEQPRYLLLLGDLDRLSLELQQVLASGDGFIGRLVFPDESGYEAYADKVLRWTREPAKGRARSLFFSAHDGTEATELGYSALVAPSIAACRYEWDYGRFPAERVVEVGSPEDWSIEQLLKEVTRELPSLLLTLSHGLGAPRDGWASASEHRARQGAMSLGWKKALEANDLKEKAFLPGGIWLYLACFGAGTPSRSAYHHWLAQLTEAGEYREPLDKVLVSLPRPGERPFIAALPQAVLANPQGPLALLGHVDLAWTYSSQGSQGESERVGHFLGLLRTLIEGGRAGVGLYVLQRALTQANVQLTSLYEQEEREKVHQREVPAEERLLRAWVWMQRQDLADYILLGDPAVRLAVRAAEAPVPGKDVSALLGFEPLDSAPVRSLEAMEEAVLALLRGARSSEELAGRVGVPLAELRRWERLYKEAGRAALAEDMRRHGR